MKKCLSILLIVCMLATSSVSFASTSVNPQPFKLSGSEAIDLSNGKPNEFTVFPRTPVNIVREADIPVDKPNGIVVKDKPTDEIKSSKAVIAASNIIYGPYSTLQLSDSKMQIILNNLKTYPSLTAVMYNGQYCYKFTSGNTIIYITKSALFKTQSGSLSENVSTAMTNNLNSGVSDPYYTTAYKSYMYSWNGMTVYRWSFARIALRAFFYSNNEIVLTSEVVDAFDVDVYDFSIQGYYPTSMKITPTLTLDITNTGTQSYYLGGYELKGVGENTSTTSIESIIQLGYKTVTLIGSILSGNLSFSNFYNLYNTVVSLGKTTQGSRKSYLSNTVPLSSAGKYSYRCSTKSPFAIRVNRDYYTLEIGTIGTKTSTTRFAVGFSCVMQ